MLTLNIVEFDFYSGRGACKGIDFLKPFSIRHNFFLNIIHVLFFLLVHFYVWTYISATVVSVLNVMKVQSLGRMGCAVNL